MNLLRDQEMGSQILVSIFRPHTYWDVVAVHLPLSVFSGIALIASYFVPTDLLPLRSCIFLELTGYPCPFCGFIRTFWAVSAGDLGFAVSNCPLGFLIYIVAVIVFFWNAIALLFGIRIERGRLLKIFHGRTNWVVCVIVSLFLINWVYRLSLGLK